MLAVEGGLKTFLGSGSAQPAPLQPVAGRVESRVKGFCPHVIKELSLSCSQWWARQAACSAYAKFPDSPGLHSPAIQ